MALLEIAAFSAALAEEVLEVEGRVAAEGAGDVGAALAADEEDAVAIENDDEAGLDMIAERRRLIFEAFIRPCRTWAAIL